MKNNFRKDFSIHFPSNTSREITNSTLIFNDWMDKNKEKHFDLLNIEKDPVIMHHCFFPKNVEIVNALNSLWAIRVKWCNNGVILGNNEPKVSRNLMLLNLKKVNGLAIFVGEPNQETMLEFKAAQIIGVNTLVI